MRVSGVRNSWLTLLKTGFWRDQFRQGLGALLFLLVSARVGKASSDLRSNEIEKASIANVKWTVTIESGHQHTGRIALCLTGNRQQ